MAGCAAAHELHKSGHDVLMLEASERIGGKTHTIMVNNHPIELGGTWLHNTTPAAKIFKRKISNILGKNVFVKVGRDEFVEETMQETYERFVNNVTNCQLSEQDAISYCDDNEKGWRWDEDFIPSCGWKQICQFLTKHVTVRYNTPVTNIEEEPGYVRVLLSNGEYVEADAVVCALPSSIIPQICPNVVFAEVIKTRATKVMISFDKVFWDPNITFFGTCETKNDPESCWEIFNYYKIWSAPVLIMECDVSKSDEMSTLSDADVLAHAIRVLERLFGFMNASVMEYHVKRFSTSKFSQGGLGLKGDFQDTRRIKFAGDWDIRAKIRRNVYRTDGEIHNAFFSGQSAAMKINRRITKL